MFKSVMIRCAFSVLVLIGVLSTPLLVYAQSSELTQNQLDSIKLNCKNAQLTMEQLEKNDAVARINRGRAYDLMLNQMSAFNSRLTYNKINQPQFAQFTSDLQTLVDTFRASYSTYDSGLSNATTIDCKNKPNDFYDRIVVARDERMSVGSIVTQIEQLATNYRNALTIYQASLVPNATTSPGVNAQ